VKSADYQIFTNKHHEATLEFTKSYKGRLRRENAEAKILEVYDADIGFVCREKGKGKREKGKDRINELSWGYHKVGGEESTERN